MTLQITFPVLLLFPLSVAEPALALLVAVLAAFPPLVAVLPLPLPFAAAELVAA